MPCLSERFQALVQLDAAEACALGERFPSNPPHAGGQVYPRNTAAKERLNAYLLEAFRELHVL